MYVLWRSDIRKLYTKTNALVVWLDDIFSLFSSIWFEFMCSHHNDVQSDWIYRDYLCASLIRMQQLFSSKLLFVSSQSITRNVCISFVFFLFSSISLVQRDDKIKHFRCARHLTNEFVGRFIFLWCFQCHCSRPATQARARARASIACVIVIKIWSCSEFSGRRRCPFYAIMLHLLQNCSVIINLWSHRFDVKGKWHFGCILMRRKTC